MSIFNTSFIGRVTNNVSNLKFVAAPGGSITITISTVLEDCINESLTRAFIQIKHNKAVLCGEPLIPLGISWRYWRNCLWNELQLSGRPTLV